MIPLVRTTSQDSVKNTHKPFSKNAMKFTQNLLKSAKILRNIGKLTRTSCMSTVGHKQEFSKDKIQQFSSLNIFQVTSDSGSLDKLCVFFFPQPVFCFRPGAYNSEKKLESKPTFNLNLHGLKAKWSIEGTQPWRLWSESRGRLYWRGAINGEFMVFCYGVPNP